MEYTWTLVSNTDDQGLGSETSLLNCNVQGPHSGQILILSNESSAQAIQNQTLPDITSPLEKDYGTNRIHSNEPRKLHLMHNRSDFVGGIDNEALDFSHLTDEFIQNNNSEANQFFHEAVDQNDHVMVRINTPYQQEPPQLFLKNASIPPIADLSFHSNTVMSNSGLPGKPTKDKSHNYTNRHNLPESPPDSEPPYSPADGVGQSPHRRTPNLQCLISANKGQIPMNSGTTGLYQKQSVTTKIPHPLSAQPLLINQSGLSSHVTHLDFNPNAREIEIAEPEYTDLLNVTMTEKKRKLCADIIGGSTGGSNVRVKKEIENCGKKPITHVSPSGRSVCSEDSYTYQDSCESGLYNDTSFQCIRFQPFQESSWNTLCDHSLKELPVPHYRVDADKGFNFSNVDDAFVCQKKNHFQITCHTQLQGDAQFVRTTEGIHKVGSFHLHFYGVKVESPGQTIKVEQSQSDRSKKSFHPVLLDLREEQVSKVTVGRLHFSETTCNNMRKKGKPNPDQRYFYLVVGLHAHCINDHDYPIVSYASERIIVRASNPGQFESDAELCWQRGTTPESIVHTGKVGINTDRPDEALVVHGNVKLTGHIIQPSDIRIKQHIQKCDTSEQLRNVQKINVVHFSYKPEFSSLFGLSLKEADTGIIAQEVQAVLPEAVTNAGGIALPNGIVYDDFLVVNKDRIFMENVGAVKELSKITSHLEARISELEQDHKRCLLLADNHPGIALSDLTTTAYSSKHNDYDTTVEKRKLLKPTSSSDVNCGKFVQISIISLTVVIASCLVFITGLFFMEHHYRNQLTFTSEHELIIKPLNINSMQAHASVVQPKDTGQLPLEIDGFFDKDKHFTCMRLRRLVTNSRSCEYDKIKTKMNKIMDRKKEDGKNDDEFISFIVKIDRVIDIVYKDVTIGVYGSYSNFTAETNVTDECGRSELLQQCSDKSLFVYGFQLPVNKQLTDYFISVSYRISKGSLNGCPTSMSVSTTCPWDPYTSLWALNGTRWNPSDMSYDWQTDKYSVSEDSESVTVIVRYKPWSYERLKASCKSPEDKRTLAIVEYTVSLHKDFSEILLDLREEQVSKVTVGRLHFSETTCNNMRKKGKPNPDQRYFYLVVGLHAHCINDHDYPIVSYASERIIVRASNPGQFESDAELCWQRGTTPESIVHTGKVGINTDRPDEALVVHGNVKLTGHIIQPSDIRIKQHIQKCDTSEQLRNVQKINVVHFSYKPEFSSLFGLSLKEADTGIIAQEVQAVLPEAVTNAGGIALPNGIVYDDFLVVNKDRIFMENVGAVKELSKITSHLEARISELEQDHKRCLLLADNHPGIALSDLTTTAYSSKHNDYDTTVEKRKLLKPTSSSDVNCGKFVQISIISLTVVIASCLVFITGLFFMEHHYRNQLTFTSEHELIIKPLNINSMQAHASVVQPKDTGQLPLEIDGFFDKDKHFTCMRLRRLVTNSRSCEYDKIKTKMNKIMDRKKEDGKNDDEFISFIVKIDRVIDIVYKDVTIGVYGSYSNFTAETNVTDECGRSELLQQCSDKSLFVYGFQLPVNKQLTDYFISVSYRISKGSLNGCPTSMSVSTTCPWDPYTSLWALNGTRWNPSDMSYDWQTDKYSVSEDSESVTVIVRYKPWSYERLKASCKSPEDKRTLAIVEYTVSLHKDFSEIL